MGILWKRAMSEREVLYLFLHSLRGASERGIGFCQLALAYGISCSTVSDY